MPPGTTLGHTTRPEVRLMQKLVRYGSFVQLEDEAEKNDVLRELDLGPAVRYSTGSIRRIVPSGSTPAETSSVATYRKPSGPSCTSRMRMLSCVSSGSRPSACEGCLNATR